MYRQQDETAPEIFYEPGGSVFVVGCLTFFVACPTTGIVGAALAHGYPELGWLALAVMMIVLSIVYVAASKGTTVTIDARSIRLSHRRAVLGWRGPEKLAWEIPLAELTEAREVTHHTPGRNGGWVRRKRLQLPRGVTLEPALLGGDGEDGSAYLRLVASLERRLGERFRKEDDFGPLGAMLRQQGGPAPPRRGE